MEEGLLFELLQETYFNWVTVLCLYKYERADYTAIVHLFICFCHQELLLTP